jgi:hypothetical protein
MGKYKNLFIICGLIIIAITLICTLISFKCLVLIISLLASGLYVHITITTLTNLFLIRQQVNTEESLQSDFVWKLICLVVAMVGFGIYFSI